jgi:DNA-binding GntR family transcriptional regulator
MLTGAKRIRPLEERSTVAEAAAERVREAILSGVYRKGQRISDSQLAEELGVSRGSTREALKLLQAQGFVIQKPNRGTYVWSPSADDVRNLCEVRVALEAHSARLLAAHHSDEDLAALHHLVDQLDAAAVANDQVAASRSDKAFHEALCRLCGNARLWEVFEREVSTLLGFFGVDAEAYQPLTQMGRELRPLCQAITAGNAEEAARLIETHIRRSTAAMAEHVETGAVPDAAGPPS